MGTTVVEGVVAATKERRVVVVPSSQENKKLSEPLTRSLKEVEKLRHELANYQKDKMSLQNAKSRLALEGWGQG